MLLAGSRAARHRRSQRAAVADLGPETTGTVPGLSNQADAVERGQASSHRPSTISALASAIPRPGDPEAQCGQSGLPGCSRACGFAVVTPVSCTYTAVQLFVVLASTSRPVGSTVVASR